MEQSEKKVVLSIQNLDVVFGHGKKAFKAVDNVSFDIYKGETLSLVGESGSGKTTIGRAIVRINPCSAGAIYYDGKKISGKLSRKDDREVVRGDEAAQKRPAGLGRVRRDPGQRPRVAGVSGALPPSDPAHAGDRGRGDAAFPPEAFLAAGHPERDGAGDLPLDGRRAGAAGPLHGPGAGGKAFAARNGGRRDPGALRRARARKRKLVVYGQI